MGMGLEVGRSMGLRVLITAGPTRERVDPVRFLSNRSSGKMGYALAEAAVAAGHEVVVISGPTGLPRPAGVEFHSVESAAEMLEAVRVELAAGVGLAILAAAVADYRPVVVAGEKLKKGAEVWSLELERTPDILGSMRGWSYRGGLVGFAAETGNLLENARGKLEAKGCDLIVANDVSRGDIGFEVDENAVTLLFADGRVEVVEKMSKRALAEKLIGVCGNLVKEGA